MGNRLAATPHAQPATLHFLQGGGETGALMRAHDWEATPLGPPESWPPALKTAVSLMLQSRQPIYIGWGPDLISFYNDGYIPICGEKHPASFGKPARNLWAEVWDKLGPLMAAGMRGYAQFYEDMPFALAGRGTDKLSYFSFSYTPLRHENGEVGGIFCAAMETTAKVLAERRLAGEAARWHRIFEQAPSFISTLRGPDHVTEFVNAAHRRLFNSGDWHGRPVREVFPVISEQGFYRHLDYVYATGERLVFTAQPVRFPGSPAGAEGMRYLDFIYAPLTEVDGRITGVFCEGYEVTEQRLAQQALIKSEEKLRLAIDVAEVATWDYDAPSGTLIWTPRLKAMFGISPDVPCTLDDFYKGLHPDDRERVSKAAAAAADPELRALYQVEYRTIGKEDGQMRWVAAKGRGLFDDNGVCERVIGTAVETTDRRNSEERLRLMVNELNHRVKNSLATVQAIVAQTLRGAGVPSKVASALTERLLALARAHDVLTNENWSGASLQDLAAQAAALYRPAGSADPFVIEGPAVTLHPRSAIAMALAFHELATNAAKYGALSKPGGHVSIRWSTNAGADGTERLSLRWEERGGPAVTPPHAPGFGTRLIERGLSRELNGAIKLHFRRAGLVCTVDAALPQLPIENRSPSTASTRRASAR